MSGFDSLVLQEQRHLKWRCLDPLENLLMVLCGICITGFSVTVFGDVIMRSIGIPWLHAQELMMALFLWGIFLGVAAATRRNDHLYLAVLAESMTGWKRLFFEIFNRGVVLAVAICFVVYGYKNFLDGFTSLRMPSMTPMAWFYLSIPICGVLVALFTIEQIVNGWKHGFVDPTGVQEEKRQTL
ncbi:MAG TPA: TRAP transporter small permease [Pseudolabrys sp.]|jgi:TRAP-type C4-dicarboxylate transport system permease small subunit|nr:TRAP transporter small permease [Pseudolabrys sp.]